MCVHGEFHQYPRLGPRPPTVTRKSLCKLKIVFVFNNDHEPPLSLLRVDPLCVGDDPERGWELSSSCRRRGKFKKQLVWVWDEGCSPGERRKPTGSCSHGRGGSSSQGIVSSCHLPVPASLATDHHIIQYRPIHLKLGSEISRNLKHRNHWKAN